MSMEADDPDTVQTEDVVEVKLTGSPELAVAVSGRATEVFSSWSGMAPKAIVWMARLTVKLCVTGVAAA